MYVALVPLFQHLPLRLGPPNVSKIAYILLCHKDPDAIIAQAEALASAGDYVAIHFDANAPQTEWDALREGVRDIAGIVLNRWGHAYISPQPGFHFGTEGNEAPKDIVKRGFGRVQFGHSELSGYMSHTRALTEGARAAAQLLEEVLS